MKLLKLIKINLIIFRKLVFNKPYTWLFINMKSQRMFKEWDEIIFDDDDDESDIEIELKKK